MNQSGEREVWRVEPTTPVDVDRALALVVGAGRAGPDILAGVSALKGYLTESMPSNYRLWWACEQDQPVAAALAVQSPGRTAVILHSTTDTGLIPIEPLSDVLAAVADEILDTDTRLVQALLTAGSQSDVRAFTAAGFRRLAELIYMRQCLRGRVIKPPGDAPPLRFEPYTEATHDLFASTIQASYEDSLDCPVLEGLRDIEDVLAGHKAAGVFRPDLWTVALCQGRGAGVALVNQNASQNVAEIVYMGVAKPFRGKSVGRAVLAHAARLASADRFGAMSLAVDAGNHYARKLYENAGFVEASRRLAYIRTQRA